MWIISKEHGAFNTENLAAIRQPDKLDDWKLVFAYDGRVSHKITSGLDNYQKIIEAIKNHDDYVEVD